MDINKTIIQVDQAGGRTVEDVLNCNAAANVNGQIGTDGLWTALYGPDEDRPKLAEVAGEVLSYEDYVDRKYGEPPGMQMLSGADRLAQWKEISAARRTAVRHFTVPSEPGQKYAYLVEHQRRCLPSDPGARHHAILPSFFKLINTLSELDWQFTLIFRTFGSDLGNVLKEWRDFVMGEHMHKPKGAVLERMKATYIHPLTGCMFREKGRLFFCYGPCVSASQCGGELAEAEGLPDSTIVEHLLRIDGCVKVVKTNFSELNQEFRSYYANSHHVGGLVDYYPYWAKSGERRDAGKVFAVEACGSTADNHYNVFFDDNIQIGKEHSIVDLRSASNAERILGDEEARYCICVNPYKAIVNEDYFIDCLCELLKKQQHDL